MTSHSALSLLFQAVTMSQNYFYQQFFPQRSHCSTLGGVLHTAANSIS